jgi:16S rRNA (adenine1518-N6/adenine1519-N6)-dimethyltransferase
MSAIDDLPPLREVIRRHSLSARKSLGQNFLLDLNLTARIARAAGPLDDATVIEIGPGPGGLTRALLAMGARHVIAVERDERALPALEEIAQRYPGRLEIVCADAQHFDPRPWLGARRAKNRRQPALQYRNRTSDRLALDRAMAALVRHDGADVSA